MTIRIYRNHQNINEHLINSSTGFYSFDSIRSEILNWLEESNIKYRILTDWKMVGPPGYIKRKIFYISGIEFEKDSDEVLFKLTWL